MITDSMMTDDATPTEFAAGSKVRIFATGEIGTVQGQLAVLTGGAPRILVDRPHGHAGQATLRQSFAASELEAIE